MSEVPVLAFVEQYASLFSFDPTFMASLSATAQRCGYSSYMSTHVTYPPKGPLPLPGTSVEFDDGCDIWSDVANQALAINPAFNIYNVFNTFPVPWDVLGDPGTYPAQQSPIYFARPDVAAALHAPPGVVWTECTGPAAVFVNGTDGSQNSAFDAFPRAIERSPRGAVVMAGLADFNLLAGGQRIIIQNMTWGGKQGFQSPIGAFNFMVDGFPAALGNVHSERGLTYYEVALAGHMLPQFSPWVSRFSSFWHANVLMNVAERIPGDAVPHEQAQDAMSRTNPNRPHLVHLIPHGLFISCYAMISSYLSWVHLYLYLVAM
jgi:carboxypeptidase D